MSLPSRKGAALFTPCLCDLTEEQFEADDRLSSQGLVTDEFFYLEDGLARFDGDLGEDCAECGEMLHLPFLLPRGVCVSCARDSSGDLRQSLAQGLKELDSYEEYLAAWGAKSTARHGQPAAGYVNAKATQG